MIAPELTIWTIGHSTRTAEEFLDLLKAYRIEAAADVRQFPGSRRFPHFSGESLQRSLDGAGIEYRHFKELGGRRKPRSDSPHTAWRNEAFRGYADYMDTGEFKSGIERLLALARRKRTVLVCAEAVWWRCHRALIADYLKAASVRVIHIIGRAQAKEHPLTAPARLVNGKLSYLAPELQSELKLG